MHLRKMYWNSFKQFLLLFPKQFLNHVVQLISINKYTFISIESSDIPPFYNILINQSLCGLAVWTVVAALTNPLKQLLL